MLTNLCWEELPLKTFAPKTQSVGNSMGQDLERVDWMGR